MMKENEKLRQLINQNNTNDNDTLYNKSIINNQLYMKYKEIIE